MVCLFLFPLPPSVFRPFLSFSDRPTERAVKKSALAEGRASECDADGDIYDVSDVCSGRPAAAGGSLSAFSARFPLRPSLRRERETRLSGWAATRPLSSHPLALSLASLAPLSTPSFSPSPSHPPSRHAVRPLHSTPIPLPPLPPSPSTFFLGNSNGPVPRSKGRGKWRRRGAEEEGQ